MDQSPLLYSIPEACRRIGVGRSTLYKLMNDQRIKSVQIGDRRLVPDSECVRFVAELVGNAPSSPPAPAIGPCELVCGFVVADGIDKSGEDVAGI